MVCNCTVPNHAQLETQLEPFFILLSPMIEKHFLSVCGTIFLGIQSRNGCISCDYTKYFNKKKKKIKEPRNEYQRLKANQRYFLLLAMDLLPVNIHGVYLV